MQRIKNMVYEHRFGLFFFAFLMCFGLFFTSGFFEPINEGITLSIYAVDFSVGFCTKLLPGAIYKLIVGEYSIESATVFFYFTLILCYAGVAFLAEKMLNIFEKEDRPKGFMLVLLFLSLFCITAVSGIAAYLLDLHWFLASIAFFILLSNRKLYFLLPLPFIYALMCHYASAICYIPVFVFIMLYKIIVCEDKKEKRYLGAILAVSFVASVGLFTYMMFFETSNLNYTFEEFTEMLVSRGVDDTSYYCYPFYKKDISSDLWVEDLANKGVELIEIDMTQPKLVILYQTILQQIQTSKLYDGSHSDIISNGFIQFSIVAVIGYLLFKRITNKAIPKSNKFIYFNSVALFFVTLVGGLCFSADTLRWLCHATMVVYLAFLYIIYINKEARKEALMFVDKIPMGVAYMFVLLSVLGCFY